MLSDCIREESPLLVGRAAAVFSPSRAYRYQLSRTWGTASSLTWIMLNPSTADALTDDPTIRRCTGFAKAWGYGGLTVVNLFALRATDPRELTVHARPVGNDNDWFIRDAVHHFALPVAAWGAHPMARARGAEVAAMLDAAGIRLTCLGTTKAGHPRHPLYVRADAPLIPYEVTP
jgi:hypothetical protein